MTSLLVRDACFARLVPQLRHPPVGARPRRSRRSRTSTSSTRSKGDDREGRPVAGRLPRRRLARLRDQAADARLPRQPAQLAAAPARDRRVPREPGQVGAHRGRGDRRRAQAEGFRQYQGHPYPHDNLLLKLLGQDGRGTACRRVLITVNASCDEDLLVISNSRAALSPESQLASHPTNVHLELDVFDRWARRTIGLRVPRQRRSASRSRRGGGDPGSGRCRGPRH